MKVLIIRFSSIGDIILTTPVIRCLKKQIPRLELHFLTRDTFKSVLAPNPYIDALHLFGEDRNQLMKRLRKERFDLVVDLHHNFRSFMVKRMLKRKSVSFHKVNIEKWLMVVFKWNLLPAAHIVDRYLETVRSLGVLNDAAGLDYFIPPDEEVKPEHLPLTHLHGYFVMAIGGNHVTKKMPVRKLKKMAELLACPVILIGGPEDRAAGEEIRAADPIKIFNGCGLFTLNQSASIIQQAKLVITHDTATLHMAAAFHKKTLSIWGNTIPGFGMSAYYGSGHETLIKSRIAETKGLWCRPCSKIGYSRCPLGHFNCMNKLNEQELAGLAHGL